MRFVVGTLVALLVLQGAPVEALEGRIETVTDRAGKATRFEYDAVGRVTKTIFPGGVTTQSVYDDAGRLLISIDARNQPTTYAYDDAGRRTSVTDALGAVTQFRYDAAGNQLEVEDALGRVTAFAYDEAGRLLRTTLADGRSTTTEYDALGRRVAEVDQAGVRTDFGYDALGRLVEVRDPLGGVTTYAYDELGNRISQTDANGHTTRFAYDSVGRQLSRTLPDGSAEHFSYDVVGQRKTRTDFNGLTTSYQYDSAGRLLRRSYPTGENPSGDSVSFTYTPTGSRATVTDARGVTTYQYDDRDRLVRQEVPEGYTLSYTWDAAGNRTSISAILADGATFGTTYAYDALGRMETVTDSRGGVYRYTYDATGQRETLSYPNGVVTSYAYDDVGRLKELRTVASDGTVIQSYVYQLGPTGNRQAVTEWDGTVRSYQYDLLYRLTNERVESGAGSLAYQNTFHYDPVGNRLRQDRMAENGSVETVAYGYDARDRLLTETSVLSGGVRDLAYGWDANGNQLSKAGTGEDGSAVDTRYAWDAENRLVSVALADGVVTTNEYDADGVWLAEEVAGGQQEGSQTGWVVDRSRPLSQVVGELNGGGSFARDFSRGSQAVGADELLGSPRSAEGATFFHQDGLQSIRSTSGSDGLFGRVSPFSSYGEPLPPTGHKTPFFFAGEQGLESAGLLYLRERWYGPTHGAFLSQDALSRLGVVDHPYRYASANPGNVVDPTGLLGISVSGMAAIGAVMGALSVVAYGTAAYTRFLGHSGVADRIEGFARILNGFAFILAAPSFGPLGLGALTAGVDELAVGAAQLMQGGRPASPLTAFLIKAGLPPDAVNTSVSLFKLICTISPRSWAEIKNVLAWARQVKSGLASLTTVPRALANWLRGDAGMIAVSSTTIQNMAHMSAIEKYRYLGGLAGLWGNWSPSALPGILLSGPTGPAAVFVDVWRSISRFYTYSLDRSANRPE